MDHKVFNRINDQTELKIVRDNTYDVCSNQELLIPVDDHDVSLSTAVRLLYEDVARMSQHLKQERRGALGHMLFNYAERYRARVVYHEFSNVTLIVGRLNEHLEPEFVLHPHASDMRLQLVEMLRDVAKRYDRKNFPPDVEEEEEEEEGYQVRD